jgi:amino acid adenylation domain-containing protein
LSDNVADLACLVADAACVTPNSPALVHGGRQISYRELTATALALAHGLAPFARGSEGVWALALPRHRTVLAAVAIAHLGGAVLPLDPHYPAERVHLMLADAEPCCLVTSRALVDRFADTRVPVVTLESLSGSRTDRPLPAKGPSRPHDPAYVVYTSGSTGVPKGVVTEYAGLGPFLRAARAAARVTPDSRVAAVASSSFDAAYMEMLIALGSGAALVVPSEPVLGGSLLGEFVSANRVTHVFGPPSALAQLEPTSVPGLEVLISGGERLPATLACRWRGHSTVLNIYGPTETTISVTLNPIDGWTDTEQAPPLGVPIDGTEILVLDEKLQQVAAGELGEFYIRGDSLGRGYLNRPALTAARFVACPGRPGERMYRTGDFGRRRPDGQLEFVGRTDDQVKVRGFRIELGEIRVAIEANPAVAAAAVVVREDRPGDRTLVAYVVRSGQGDVAQVRPWLADRLPAYLLPDHVLAVDALPLNPNGKLDPTALPTPVPAVNPLPPTVGHSPAQAVVLDIWRRVLGRGELGLDENFFDLGGNSIRLIQVRNALRDEHGVAVSAVTLFENTTVRQLADAVAAPLGERS